MDGKDTASFDAKRTEQGCQLVLLQMPNEILEKILTYLTFDEISVCRQVFNTLSHEVLCDI